MIVLQFNWVLFWIILIVILLVFSVYNSDDNSFRKQTANSSDEFEKKKAKQRQKNHLNYTDLHWIFKLNGQKIKYKGNEYDYEKLCDIIHYEKIKRFRENTSKIPPPYDLQKKGWNWVSRQRKKRKDGKMSEGEK